MFWRSLTGALLAGPSLILVFASSAVAQSHLAASSAQTASIISLKEALDLARDNSVRLRIAQARGDAAEAGIDGAKSAYYPKLQALAKTPDYLDHRSSYYQRSTDEVGQAQVNMQYTMLDFGRRKADLTRTKLDKQGTDSAYAQEVQDGDYATVRAYIDSERYGKMVAIAEDHIAELTRLTSLIEHRVQGGLSPDSELVRSRLALTNARSRQKGLRQRLQQAQQSLRSITGQVVTSGPLNVDLNKQSTQDLDSLGNLATEQNFALQSLQAQAASAQEVVNKATADRYPRLDVVASYASPFQQDRRSDMGGKVSLQLSMDIFDGGLKRSRVDQAGAAQREAAARYDLTRREVRSQVDNMIVDARTSYEQWQLTVNGEKQATRTQALYLDEFRLGTRSVNDLISAQNDVFSQRVDNVDAYSNYMLSVLGLHYVKGDTRFGLMTLGLLSE